MVPAPIVFRAHLIGVVANGSARLLGSWMARERATYSFEASRQLGQLPRQTQTTARHQWHDIDRIGTVSVGAMRPNGGGCPNGALNYEACNDYAKGGPVRRSSHLKKQVAARLQLSTSHTRSPYSFGFAPGRMGIIPRPRP